MKNSREGTTQGRSMLRSFVSFTATLLLVCGAVAVPSLASAADNPTPSPTPSVSDPGVLIDPVIPDPSVTPDPSASVTPDPTVTPSPTDPTPSTPADPSPSASDPGALIVPDPSPSPTYVLPKDCPTAAPTLPPAPLPDPSPSSEAPLTDLPPIGNEKPTASASPVGAAAIIPAETSATPDPTATPDPSVTPDPSAATPPADGKIPVECCPALLKTLPDGTPIPQECCPSIVLADGQLMPIECCPTELPKDGVLPLGCPDPTPAYPLEPGGTNINYSPPTMMIAATDPIHGPYVMTTDSCGACHRTHSQKSPSSGQTPKSALCFTCHNSTGSNGDTQTEYVNAAAKPNVPATRSYYSHAANIVTSHNGFTLDENGVATMRDEFSGVSNRHSECTDCHNPHNMNKTLSTQTGTTGWTSSGYVKNAGGVSVVNGAAGAAPTYTVQPTSTTLEYQLCFKCHSGNTTLPADGTFPKSQIYLDKAKEFNPANGSFHPIEAAGTNRTTAMAGSLSLASTGATNWKLWSLTTTSTIRCTNCHADTSVSSASGGGQVSKPHFSPNRGILIRNYRDRLTRTNGTTNTTGNYVAADFALCYACHTNAPFESGTATTPRSTNFSYHYYHTNGSIRDKGSTTLNNIDTPGAGGGSAICAECHYRLHSNTFPGSTQTLPATNSRLVNFAPNVTGLNGTGAPIWRNSSGNTWTCTLRCHGANHSAYSYSYTP